MQSIKQLYMKSLLKKVEVIKNRYALINAENAFNIFEILRNRNDEVHLHSQFIYELLNPNGNHQYGKKITEALIDIIGVPKFNTKRYKVYKEYKNIDILLKNDRQAVIIENKIWAKDQDKQLERYHDIITQENITEIFIYYLSPYGKEPDKESLGSLSLQSEINSHEIKPDIVHLISYSNHILNWLDRCLDITTDKPRLKEVIIQYKDTVNNLTGKASNMEQRLELYKLLGESNNMESALSIARNWVHMRWHTEWDFWKCFETKLKSENITILEEQKYSPENLNCVIHQVRNKNYWYGLKFELSLYKNEKVYLMIQRGHGQVVFGVKTSGKYAEELYKLLNDSSEVEVQTKWCYKSSFDPTINFEEFSNNATLALSNDKIREERIDAYYDQVKNFITRYKDIVKSPNSVAQN
jgi:hypothetical protein